MQIVQSLPFYKQGLGCVDKYIVEIGYTKSFFKNDILEIANTYDDLLLCISNEAWTNQHSLTSVKCWLVNFALVYSYLTLRLFYSIHSTFCHRKRLLKFKNRATES